MTALRRFPIGVSSLAGCRSLAVRRDSIGLAVGFVPRATPRAANSPAREPRPRHPPTQAARDRERLRLRSRPCPARLASVSAASGSVGPARVIAISSAARIEALEALAARAHRLRQLAGSGACAPRDPPGAGHEARDRGPGEQQQAAGEHQDGQDLRPEPLEERGRGPVERFAGGSSVDGEEALLEVAVTGGMVRPQPGGLRREGQEQRGEQQHRPRVQRPGSRDERAHDQRHAPAGERQRRHVGDPARGVLERPLQPLPHRAPRPNPRRGRSPGRRRRPPARARSHRGGAAPARRPASVDHEARRAVARERDRFAGRARWRRGRGAAWGGAACPASHQDQITSLSRRLTAPRQRHVVRFDAAPSTPAR